MPEPEDLNPILNDIKALCETRNTLQAQATLAACQGEKSAEVQHLEEEIACLHSNLSRPLVSGQTEGRGYAGNTDGMDTKAISLLICYSIIHKEHFEDILHNRFKPENILKLSTNFATIKPWVRYIKVGDSIELATHKDDSTMGEAKSIAQLLWCFLLYGQIIIHFAPPTVQLELSIALAAYVDHLLGHFMVYTWETLCLFHFHFHRARIAMGVYDPVG